MTVARYIAQPHVSVGGAINRAHVIDTETGQTARQPDGRLAYFPRLPAAERWAEVENDAHRRRTTFEPRMRLLSAATHAGTCRDHRDMDGVAYWQAEADAARIELCEALGDEQMADHWRAYYIEHYGSKPA